MRVLVLGGDGMLGHQLLLGMPDHDVRVTLRRELRAYSGLGLFNGENTYGDIDVRETEPLRRVVETFRPEVVVNAAGIVKQRPEARDAALMVDVNALFPHRLAVLAGEAGSRVVHISTDCVFSGRLGARTERDAPDPVDLYGRTKLFGEPTRPSCVTLRTSMFGLELGRRHGLVEWALRQHEPVRGYRRAVFSGLLTTELVRVVDLVLSRVPDLHGVWHVAATPISKFEFLSGLLARVGGRATVKPDDDVQCDRSLDGAAFAAATGYEAPSWDSMLDDLAASIVRRRAA